MFCSGKWTTWNVYIQAERIGIDIEGILILNVHYIKALYWIVKLNSRIAEIEGDER